MYEMTIDVYQTGAVFPLFDQMRIPDLIVKSLSTHNVCLLNARL